MDGLWWVWMERSRLVVGWGWVDLTLLGWEEVLLHGFLLDGLLLDGWGVVGGDGVVLDGVGWS